MASNLSAGCKWANLWYFSNLMTEKLLYACNPTCLFPKRVVWIGSRSLLLTDLLLLLFILTRLLFLCIFQQSSDWQVKCALWSKSSDVRIIVKKLVIRNEWTHTNLIFCLLSKKRRIEICMSVHDDNRRTDKFILCSFSWRFEVNELSKIKLNEINEENQCKWTHTSFQKVQADLRDNLYSVLMWPSNKTSLSVDVKKSL